jgi:hypothetical protein
LGKFWNESEWGGEWRGVWNRRGLSPFFDVVLHRGSNQTKTFFAGVTVRGSTIHIVTQNSTDGRNCIYDGTISGDGKKVSGTYGFGDGSVNPWSATIEPLGPIDHVPAPPGVFYLLRSKSITSDDGISGLIAGTQVSLVEDQGDTVFVKAGSQQLELPRTDLTNDAVIAQYLADTERSIQQFIRQRGQEEAHAIAEARQLQEKLLAQQRDRDIAAMGQQAAQIPGWSNPLARQAYGVTQRTVRVFGGNVASSGPPLGSSGSTQQEQNEKTRAATEALLKSQIEVLRKQQDHSSGVDAAHLQSERTTLENQLQYIHK